MSVLICGSLAYDTIMVFPDQFKRHILPDQVHILNVAFLVPKMRREFGGCAGNIAYNLKLLGGDPVPMATVGQDFDVYAKRLDGLGITRKHLLPVEDRFTAQAFITTDLDDNQITAFHPGAMEESHRNRVGEAADIELGLVGPDGKQAMIQHSEHFAEAGIPFIFDPGQGLPMFDGEELKRFIKQATWVAANDYECKLMLDRTGYSVEQIAQQVQAFVVTRGGEGSVAYTSNGVVDIPAISVETVADPTGCGDAYRAGLLYGFGRKLELETTLHIASLMGGIKIEHQGTQNHSFNLEQFHKRFEDVWGYALPQ